MRLRLLIVNKQIIPCKNAWPIMVQKWFRELQTLALTPSFLKDLATPFDRVPLASITITFDLSYKYQKTRFRGTYNHKKLTSYDVENNKLDNQILISSAFMRLINLTITPFILLQIQQFVQSSFNIYVCVCVCALASPSCLCYFQF